MDRRIRARIENAIKDCTSYKNYVDNENSSIDEMRIYQMKKKPDSTCSNNEGIAIDATAINRRVDAFDGGVQFYPNIVRKEENIRESICIEFRRILSNRNPDEDELDSLVLKIQKKYGFTYLGIAVLQTYIEFYKNPCALQALCSSLIRFDGDEVKPWGQSMILGLINHPSEAVKESVVELIDNWSDSFVINALKTIEISSEWLKQYVADVVSRLESNDVLHKKII